MPEKFEISDHIDSFIQKTLKAITVIKDIIRDFLPTVLNLTGTAIDYILTFYMELMDTIIKNKESISSFIPLIPMAPLAYLLWSLEL